MIDLSRVKNYYVACGYTDIRRGIEVAVVRPPFLIDFPRRAHTRDEFGHEKSQPVILPTGCYADMRLCVSPQILYDNDCFGRSVKPAVNGQAVILPPTAGGWRGF